MTQTSYVTAALAVSLNTSGALYALKVCALKWTRYSSHNCDITVIIFLPLWSLWCGVISLCKYCCCILIVFYLFHAVPLEVTCVQEVVLDTPILFYRCSVQPPLIGVTLTCSIEGQPLENCTILYKFIHVISCSSTCSTMSGVSLQIDPRLYEAGVTFTITVVATAPDGRTNSTSIDFVGTGPDGTPPSLQSFLFQREGNISNYTLLSYLVQW